MQNLAKREDVGIIIGRFQVHKLHEAHIELINTVKKSHDRVIIFIGLSPLRSTIRNPLDFNTRKRLIQEQFPDVEIYYISDNRSDEVWSKKLDQEITRWLKPHQTAVLYGSRDSFISHYSGKYPTKELESTIYVSGTAIRTRIANNYNPPNEAFRAGVISSTFDRYPVCYTAVDVAVIDFSKNPNMVLLGKKPGESELRFIGGFTSVNSPSLEADARREVMEESGVEIESITYIGSMLVDDWRYRSEHDKIKTTFFTAAYVFGRPEGADDLESVQWVSLLDLVDGKIQVVEEHIPLVAMLAKKFGKAIN
jgi:bifunctional NMN adenylyltransferase/nudix hydrolase